MSLQDESWPKSPVQSPILELLPFLPRLLGSVPGVASHAEANVPVDIAWVLRASLGKKYGFQCSIQTSRRFLEESLIGGNEKQDWVMCGSYLALN